MKIQLRFLGYKEIEKPQQKRPGLIKLVRLYTFYTAVALGGDVKPTASA